MGTFLMKLYTKKEKKLSGSFWEINILSEKLTTTDDGRRRRTTTDDDGRRTTDESALEKLRCLSAGGAKKGKQFENQFFIYEPKCKQNMYIFDYLGGPWEGVQLSD